MTPKGDWHLAQINIARLTAPRGDPRVADFFAALAGINALSEASPGFVWRLKDDSGDATGLEPTPDPLLVVNMSAWQDVDALFDFVYRTAHAPVMARRREWMERPQAAYQALWWIRAGTEPTINDGLSRLWMLDRFGPSAHAFTFKTRFPRPDEAVLPLDRTSDPWCPDNRNSANG